MSQHRFYQTGTCFKSKHRQVYKDLKIIGKFNYIKLPSQYLWDNTNLQKKMFFFFFWHYNPWWILAFSTIALFVLGPGTYVSNTLYLQIIVHAGLSPLFPSGFRLQRVLKVHIFYGVGLLAPRPTPNLEDQGIPFSLGHHLDPSGMGGSTGSYATTRALSII